MLIKHLNLNKSLSKIHISICNWAESQKEHSFFGKILSLISSSHRNRNPNINASLVCIILNISTVRLTVFKYVAELYTRHFNKVGYSTESRSTGVDRLALRNQTNCYSKN